MNTSFFKVFPVLNLDSECTGWFSDVSVAKVTASKAKQRICVYIESGRLLPRNIVKAAECEIKRQLFGKAEAAIKLCEHYTLSEQHTPEVIFEMYYPAIMDELTAESELEASLFHKAPKEFLSRNKLHIEIPENFVAAQKMKRVSEVVTQIYRERFDIDLEIEITQLEKSESRYAKDAEEALRQEVHKIVATYEETKKEAKEELKHEKEEAQKKKEFVRREKTYQQKKIVDKDIFYGRGFEGEETPICDIVDEIGEVVVRGQIFFVDTREIRNEKTIIIFNVTDFTDSITAKLFVKNEMLADVLSNIKKGNFIRMKGMAVLDKFDREISIASVVGIKKIPDFRQKRADNSPRKRVELHAHTMMSDMDSVADCTAMLEAAYGWGHPACAITDHGVVQAFPDANHYIEKIDGAAKKAYQSEHPEADKAELKGVAAPFKVIYGVEAYIVDDLKEIVFNSKGQSLDGDFVVFDIETTGFSPVKNKIIEIGAVKVSKGAITDRFSTFVNPEVPIPFEIEKLTSINDDMVMDAPVIETVLPEFMKFCDGCMMVEIGRAHV